MNFPNIWLHKPNNIKKLEIHHEGAVVQQPHAHQKNPHPTSQKHLCQTPVFSSCLLINFQSWSGCNGHLPNRISSCPTPPAQAGPPTAGCPEQWADGLWVSPKGENPQFPWAICVKAQSLSQSPDVQKEPPVVQVVLIASHPQFYNQSCLSRWQSHFPPNFSYSGYFSGSMRMQENNILSMCFRVKNIKVAEIEKIPKPQCCLSIWRLRKKIQQFFLSMCVCNVSSTQQHQNIKKHFHLQWEVGIPEEKKCTAKEQFPNYTHSIKSHELTKHVSNFCLIKS